MTHQNESESPQPVAEADSLVGVASTDLFGVWYPGPENGGGGTAGPCSEKHPSGTWWDGDQLLVAVNVRNNQTGLEWTEYHAVQIVCDEESFSVEEIGTGDDIGWGPESWAWWMRIPSLPNDQSPDAGATEMKS